MIQQKYNPARIQLLYQMLVSNLQQGHPREYDIKVDELKVVQRTADPEQFFLHEEFILPDTQSVTITLYEKSSNRNNRHVFVLNEAEPVNPKNAAMSLDGLEKVMDEKMDRERQKWQLELLQKENASLKEKLEEAEDYNDELETALDELKAKKIETGKNFGVVLSGLVEGFVRNNPSIVKRLPGGESLAGLLESDNQKTTTDDDTNAAPAPQVSFTKKRVSSDNSKMDSTTAVTASGNSEEAYLNTLHQQSKATGLDPVLLLQLQQLQQVVPAGPDRETLHKVLQVFSGSPHLIKEIWELFDEAYRKQVFTDVQSDGAESSQALPSHQQVSGTKAQVSNNYQGDADEFDVRDRPL